MCASAAMRSRPTPKNWIAPNGDHRAAEGRCSCRTGCRSPSPRPRRFHPRTGRPRAPVDGAAVRDEVLAALRALHALIAARNWDGYANRVALRYRDAARAFPLGPSAEVRRQADVAMLAQEAGRDGFTLLPLPMGGFSVRDLCRRQARRSGARRWRRAGAGDGRRRTDRLSHALQHAGRGAHRHPLSVFR